MGVTKDALFALAFGPPPIAVHDDSNMTGHA